MMLEPVRDIIGTAHIVVLGQLPPREIALSIPKLTLTQTLTLTRGDFSSRAIVWLRPNPKTNPKLVPNPNPNWSR